MAVLQRRNPATAADRLRIAIGRNAEVRVVNRQICVIMTPLAADEVAAELLAPKSTERRRGAEEPAATQAPMVVVPDAAPAFFEHRSPLVIEDFPPVIVENFTPRLAEDRGPISLGDFPPVIVVESVSVQPEPEPVLDEAPLPDPFADLPPLVAEHRSPVVDSSAEVAPPASVRRAPEPQPARSRASRISTWKQRLEVAVRDELDWYRKH